LEEREDVGPQTVDDRRGDDEAYAGDYQGDGVEGDVQSEGDEVVLDEVVQLGCGETATTDPSVISIGQRAQGTGHRAQVSDRPRVPRLVGSQSNGRRPSCS
jgi:hypothetical protein